MSHPLLFLCQISAILLRYPDELIKQESSELGTLVSSSDLTVEEKKAFEDICDFLRVTPLLDAQSQYVQLFDMSPSLSLYLFQHVHGDSRMRGQAMVDLLEDYRAAGLDMKGNELPDFLPAYLEYASLCEPEKTRDLLAEIVDILAVLRDRLQARQSVYSGLFRVLQNASGRVPDKEIVHAHLRDTAMMDDPATLDARYEEKPVTFENASPPTGCQTMRHANSDNSHVGSRK
ncbi:nitrate reductase molybdenum cofactor assembly chaperone [Acetobacter orleanensis]|uniref:Nitrate reductase molybdenum cofactor assembly chaperone n=1 Tax=Acetobacter orleanensis TaxID=104099 RepID=A0A4Y3TPW3_9PROT|nr:nitrate reductase molybdenum cofactor assembly chaperone [Acetobacter orleanensis]PCD79034.1 nitrate reductase molybdenum cofactor assembly chaperone [Acetobacter orleanensis]GAN67760.1 respiratory nitrate reductase subunit delta [Acetobacter orleanensis JCM 7639]GEB83097.1 nitrate reductase molybdenum cofactor assembly chaperone [Acetobacter orleanensis]